jgi:AI-2E family transporter
LIVLFSGIYFAVYPHTYVRLAARIAPEGRPNDVPLMLYQTSDVLRRWLIGRASAMALIGGMTYVGLLILGVTIAFVLALFAGLAGFLPYLGPIIGAVPRRRQPPPRHLGSLPLCARSVRRELPAHAADPGARRIPAARRGDPQSPLIQARAASLPPAVVILNQLVLGVLFGILGLALATKRLRRFILVRAHYAC